MKKPYARIACLSLASVLSFAVVQAQPVTITPMTSFGGGDGNLTVAEADANALANGHAASSILGTGDLNRGMAFNRATNNLILVSRGAAGPHVNVLDATTGNFVRRLSSAGFSGGIFTASTVSATDDGQLFVANLRGADPSPFNVYRFANDSTTDASTRVFSNTALGWRIGDSFDVTGTGNSVRMVAGGGGTAPGYLLLDQTGPTAFSHTLTNFGTTVSGDFRLGITFAHGSARVLGTQGGPVDGGSYLHVTDPNVPAHLGVTRLNWRLERFLDARFINGFHMLATSDMGANIRIYNIDDVLNPVFRTMFTSPFAAATNGNATGSIQWGSVNGKNATLYVMNTNNGIQAYNVEVVPEPATLLALGAGVAALVARRRRKA